MRILFFVIVAWLLSISVAVHIANAASYRQIDAQELTQVFAPENLLKNGHFEKNANNWTASGSSVGARTTTASEIYRGVASGSWDASATGEFYTSTAVAIPNGMYGTNGVVACYTKTTATDIKLQAFDGTNVLSETTLASSTYFTPQTTNFIFPTSGNISMRLASQSNSAEIDFECYVGSAFNISQVSQAGLIATGYIETNAACDVLTRTNTALGAFATDAGCTGPVVEFNGGPGTLQTTDADGPIFTVNNLAPGYYRVHIRSGWTSTQATGNVTSWAVNDGTTTSGATASMTAAANGGSGTADAIGYFNYTTSGNKTFTLYGASSSGTTTLSNGANNARIQFSIERWPTSSETVYRADQGPASWSGFHTTTCLWSRAATTFADPAGDATCSLTEKTNRNFGTVSTVAGILPGLTFTPTRAGRYEVCAITRLTSVTSFSELSAGLTADGGTNYFSSGGGRGYSDGVSSAKHSVTLCGIVNVPSVTATTVKMHIAASSGTVNIADVGASPATIDWTIKGIDQSFPAPLLVNSVVNTSSGVTRTEVAKLNCDSGSTITSQHGSWVSTIGNIASGSCTVTLIAGTFSGTPYCQATMISGTTGAAYILRTNAVSSTSVTVAQTLNGGGDATLIDFYLQCVGAK